MRLPHKLQIALAARTQDAELRCSGDSGVTRLLQLLGIEDEAEGGYFTINKPHGMAAGD